MSEERRARPAAPLSSAPSLASSRGAPSAAPPDADANMLGGFGRDGTTRWEERGELGHGGMGTVTVFYDRWLAREVAIKVPISEEDARRLLHEALVTARLDHPGVVPIHDAGVDAAGRPFFAMRLVRGRSLAEALAGADRHERMRLLRHVLAAAEAVSYAHTRGIVHRDLKPANIMIGAFGETQVIDWGLALLPDAPSPDPGRAGTPHAMSPEQARGEALDPRADVYGLGVVLYELATGAPPFSPERDREAILARLAAGETPRLTPDSAPIELVAIVNRALAADASHRYPDATALASDLERYLGGRRVQAHAYTQLELLTRLARAWRGPLLVAAAALVALAIVLALAFDRVARERDRTAQELAQRLVGAARGALREEDWVTAERFAAQALAREPTEALGVLAALPDARPVRTLIAAALDCPATTIYEPAGATPLVLCHAPDRLALWRDGGTRWALSLASEQAIFADGGREVVADFADGRIERFDVANGARIATIAPYSAGMQLQAGADSRAYLRFAARLVERFEGGARAALPVDGCLGSRVRAVTLAEREGLWAWVCADGATVVGADGTVTWERIETGLPRSPHGPLPTAVAFQSDILLLVGDDAGRLTRVDLNARASDDDHEPREVMELAGGLVRAIAVSPRGDLALVTSDAAPPMVVDLARWSPLGRLPQRSPTRPVRAAFAADGSVLVADDALERWDFRAAMPRDLRFPFGIGALALSADGRHLVVGSGATATVVDPETRRVRARHRWQDDLIKSLALGPCGPGETLADPRCTQLAGLALGGVRAPRFAAHAATAPLNDYHTDALFKALVIIADGSAVAIDYAGCIAHLTTDAPPVRDCDSVASSLAASPDGRYVAVLTRAHRLVRMRDLADGRPWRPGPTFIGGRALALRDDGSAAIVTRDSVVALGSDDRVQTRYQAPGADLLAVATGADVVAAGGREGDVWIWRRDDPQARAVVRTHDRRVQALVVDPAGRWIATGAWDGRLAFLRPPWEPALIASTPAAVEAAWRLDASAATEAVGSPSR